MMLSRLSAARMYENGKVVAMVLANVHGQTLRFVQSLPKRERQPLASKFKNADAMAVDMLEKMLVFNPKQRIDAGQALAHPYLAPYHDPSDEPVADEKFDWSFNDADLPVDTWKIMMCVICSNW